MNNLAGGAWLDVDKGCPVQCSVSGSNEAYLLIGKPPHTYELTIALEPMRTLVAQTTAALAKMAASAQREADERTTGKQADQGQTAEPSS